MTQMEEGFQVRRRGAGYDTGTYR